MQFGVFELDLQQGELRKQGVKVKLQEQPLKILQLLLETPGQIVSREQLRAHVWSANTFVEFDKGLYSAMARLRDVLGDTSDSPRFIETVARRGYRFIAPTTMSGPAPAKETVTESLAPVEKSEKFLLRRLLASLLAGLLGGALLLMIVLSFNIAGAREWLRSRSTPIRSLAVLPLENLSGDPQQEYFADGMTDELITNLARLGNLRVVSRTSIMRYKKISKPLAQVAEDLNVDAVVEGTVERAGNRVRIRVQLIRAATDQHLWAQTYDRELRDTLLLQSEAAGDIVREIQVTLTPPQRQRLAVARQVDPQAYEAYLKGLYFSNKRSGENFKRAIDYFQEAIARDPNYAAAYSGLSNAFVGQMFTGTPTGEVREKAAWAALKSIELDPDSPEAHDTLGGVHEFYDWDWPGAEKEYRRAIELNPNFAAGHQDLAIFLSLQGRFEAGLAEAQRAQDLDPLSPFIRTTYCLDLDMARQYQRAIEKCNEALELDPNFLHAHGNLAGIYESAGMYDRSLEEVQKAAAIGGESPERLASLGKIFMQGGITAVWHEQLRQKLKAGGNADPYEVASLYAKLGDANRGFLWLQKTYEQHSPRMEEVKEEPTFDNLRSDARFQDFLRRARLAN